MVSKYLGMTVNERLYVSGKTVAFDRAVKEKDFNAMRAILKEVDLQEESIKPIIEKFQ